MGNLETLKMSEVTGGAANDVPGLVGPQQFRNWRLKMDFVSSKIKGPSGSRKMCQERSGHPQLDMTEYPEDMDVRTIEPVYYADSESEEADAARWSDLESSEPGQNGSDSESPVPALV